MKKTVIILAPFLLIACNTTRTSPPDISGAGKTTISSPTTLNPEAVTSSASPRNADIESKKLAAEKLNAEKLAASKLATDIKEIQNKSIYFDFDKYSIQPEYQDVIKQQATFIMAHKNDFVTVEGNADERGSDEYNLALGDRRANAAQKLLQLLGVPASQISTKSFGEEKPRLTCHEEKCWKENRRDDFIHKIGSANHPAENTQQDTGNVK